jgi:hypothetical protein
MRDRFGNFGDEKYTKNDHYLTLAIVCVLIVLGVIA